MGPTNNLSVKIRKGEFSFKEDNKILELVKKYEKMYEIDKRGIWVKIASHFDNRTRDQLYNRYYSYLLERNIKKGAFTKAEDIVLMVYGDKFGNKFNNCVKYLPNRSRKQCRGRYAESLMRTIKKGNWTLEEDQKLWEHVSKYGSQNWSKLRMELNRSAGQLRLRYSRLKVYMKAPMSYADLKDVVPRKTWNRVEPGRYEFCRYVFFVSI